MTQPLLPQRPAGLGDQVANELRRQIITQSLQTGVLLVEEKLATDFGVSRGPIRDAIRILTQEGLVISTGRSASVVGLSAADIDELFTLRASLELLALRVALGEHADELDQNLARSLAAMTRAAETGDTAAFTRADVQFHSSFYAASHHRRLSDVWSQYQPTIENLLLVANLEHTGLPLALQSHVYLAGLIQTRAFQPASNELESHLDRSRLRVRREYAGG
ncbi:GntR family transcriptional regulator [Cryobacterium sp. Y62]|uniref:GntR family transcriptional regulator n=1 Tax=Cryobacterium sp. Y62 TaxID=2048284 RepID=UPI000CE55356|nr:GntR family transcriptional regulator [Cryobacterium sp. Y62]